MKLGIKISSYYLSYQMLLTSISAIFSTEPASKLPNADRRHISIYMKRKKINLRFAKLNEGEVEIYLLLESIDTKTSFAYDKVHPLLLSLAALEIFRQLTFIRNLSIKHGILPNNLKTAKVIPTLKQGSRTLCNNYRPSSLSVK